MRVGLVGGGPRALWAAEELFALFRDNDLPLSIVCWDPEEPGAGRVYRADQPLCWRLNVRSDIVRTRLGSFSDWLESRQSHDRKVIVDGVGAEQADIRRLASPFSGKCEMALSGEDKIFPPRALVGEFLRMSWLELAREFKDVGGQNELRHVCARVEDIHSADDGCRIEVANNLDEIVDEALIVTGHAATWRGRWEGAIAANDFAALNSIKADSDVVVRGMALTFIDTCLALTEARGGRFVPDHRSEDGGQICGMHPNPAATPEERARKLRYIPSGKEPSRIFPFSRSAKLMSIKPAPSNIWSQVNFKHQEEFEERIRNCSDVEHLRVILREAEENLLDSARQFADSVRRARKESVIQLPDRQWATGEVWRRLYGALVERVSYSEDGDLEGFHDLEREMEPLAFGPPALTAKKIDALVEAGIVVLPLKGGEPAIPPQDAVRVDAVIAPPGVQPETLLAKLVERGEATLLPQGGVAVDRCGVLRGKHVAVIGRDVSPRVIGHDTLNRTMHGEIPNWARMVLQRAKELRGDKRG